MNHPDDTTRTAPPAVLPRKPQTLHEVVATHPVGTLVASAAVGVGLMALLSSASHRSSARQQGPAAAPVPAQPHASYADLQVQLTQLVRNMAQMLPSKAEARQIVDDKAQPAGKEATRTWGQLADEAEQVVRNLTPGMHTASQAAREHPVATAVVVGALGALAASWVLGRESADAPAATQGSEAEVPPLM